MPTDAGRSHYVILGVGERATSKEIRVAYLNLARVLHPDRVGDGSEAERRLAERRMREVNESYEVLRDARRRAEYDRSLGSSSGGSASGGSSAGGSSSRTSAREPGSRPTSSGAPPRRPAGNPERFDANPSLRDDEGRLVHQWAEDDVELSPAVAFLIQRGPVILMVAVAVVLFILTAYAGGPKDDAVVPTGPTTTCVGVPSTVMAGGEAVQLPC